MGADRHRVVRIFLVRQYATPGMRSGVVRGCLTGATSSTIPGVICQFRSQPFSSECFSAEVPVTVFSSRTS